jgi:Tol biopolymer transport system component
MAPPVIDGDDPKLLTSRTDDGQEDGPPLVRRRRWAWVAAGLIVAVPIVLTLAGALTSPPHTKGVPVGHLIYLEADEPSDHTSILRGLRIMGTDGASRQLLHETEPQDSDSGSREWITQPKASPHGTWLAFEKQLITLQEEKQGIDNQLWVMPLTGKNPQPRMLMDLTQRHLKQFVGLTWADDDEQLSFLEDATVYSVPRDGSGHEQDTPIKGVPALKTAPDISATRSPYGDPEKGMSYEAMTPQGTRAIIAGGPTLDATVFAVSPDGSTFAGVTPDTPSTIVIRDPSTVRRLPVRWGWSALGQRHITAMHWSPDGRYLAYSVGKPPLEDELFYVELATGRCFQLPVRTGQAGWDWAP